MRALHAVLCLSVALLTSACNVVSVVPVVPIAPNGVRIMPEVAYGYEAYADTLRAWGTWEADGEYGVRWCPREDAVEGSFQPYASRGRWEVSEAPVGRAPAGTPAWVSEDSDTWGAITTRHGWWVHGHRWCWIPGVEETPGRVVWRWGDGFVGWAPEAPACVAYDDVEYEALDWMFTLLGTLLDESPDRNALAGDAREAARRLTAPARSPGAPINTPRVGPPARSIGDARTALQRYAETHAVTMKQAAASAAVKSGSSSGSSGSSGSSASKSSGSKSANAKEPAVVASVYYDTMMADPLWMPAAGMPLVPNRMAAPVAMGAGGHAGTSAAALTGGHAHAAGGRSAGGGHVAAPSRSSGGSSFTYRSSGGSKSSSSGSSSSKSSSRSSGRSHR